LPQRALDKLFGIRSLNAIHFYRCYPASLGALVRNQQFAQGSSLSMPLSREMVDSDQELYSQIESLVKRGVKVEIQAGHMDFEWGTEKWTLLQKELAENPNHLEILAPIRGQLENQKAPTESD